MINEGKSSAFDKKNYVCCSAGRLLRAVKVREHIFEVGGNFIKILVGLKATKAFVSNKHR
jgi:hypothetical protein